MDSYDGAARLDWWANRSTCLGSYGVRVAVRVSGDVRTCEATVEPRLSAEDQEGFDFLMELDPLFTLRFDDESTVLVEVVATGGGRLVLTAFRGETAVSGSRRIPT